MCPCCSGKSYEECCRPYHEGRLAENAEKLMRSRFSAYALNLPEYIIITTHPASPQYHDNHFSWKRSLSEFSKGSNFQKLEVHDFKERDNLATVTFTAYIDQNGHDTTFTEKSYFEKREGRWFYRTGLLREGHAPSLITTAPLRVLPLAYYGDPILQKKAEPIEEITKEVVALAEEMIETMDACNGLGLAAPQVHHSVRLFVIRIPVETEEGKREPGEAKVFINPKIVSKSDDTWVAPEGCLSIPAVQADVVRPKEITVEYTDLEGNKHKETFTGWEGKAICHENDHIDGILFIDHLDDVERANLEPFLIKLKNRIHGGGEL